METNRLPAPGRLSYPSFPFEIADLDQPAALGFPSAPYPAQWIEERARPLLAVLETIRAELGGTLQILSAYRSPAFNEVLRAIGLPVARNSQHCQGRAADIAAEATPMEIYSAVLHLHRSGAIRIGGLGVYSGWVHVDIRPGPLARWMR